MGRAALPHIWEPGRARNSDVSGRQAGAARSGAALRRGLVSRQRQSSSNIADGSANIMANASGLERLASRRSWRLASRRTGARRTVHMAAGRPAGRQRSARPPDATASRAEWGARRRAPNWAPTRTRAPRRAAGCLACMGQPECAALLGGPSGAAPRMDRKWANAKVTPGAQARATPGGQTNCQQRPSRAEKRGPRIQVNQLIQ